MTYQKLQFGAVQELAKTYSQIQDLRKQRNDIIAKIKHQVACYQSQEKAIIKDMAEDDEDKEGYLTYVDGDCVYTVSDVFNNITPSQLMKKAKAKHAKCEDEDEYDGPSPMSDPADFERRVIVSRTLARRA